MLEQPPERDISEVEAEVAAQSQQPQERKVHGCFRIIVNAMPSCIAVILSIGLLLVGLGSYGGSSARSQTALLIAGIILLLAITYGIGLFDANLSHEVRLSPAEQRRRKVLMHALVFTGYQIILIPASMASVVGIGAAVCSGIRI
jgi:hypothetical protein